MSTKMMSQKHSSTVTVLTTPTTTTTPTTATDTPSISSKSKNAQNTTTALSKSTNGFGSAVGAALSDDCNGIVIKTEEKDSDDNGSLASVGGGSAVDDVAEDEAISNESFIHARPRPILLSSVNPHIICNLCQGYLINATTIVECLHSFCHSCLMKHLRTEKYCPRCEMMINTAKPNIKPDTTLQAIVYKLVPGLYEKELMRKRAFYKDLPEEAALATPEQRGDDTEHLIFGPTDNMSLSLEYADIDDLIDAGTNGREYSELRKPRYLQCPAMYTVSHLKKFVHGKFSIDSQRFGIDIMYKVKTIILLDHYTLMDVAYIYTWKRDAPMRFYFRVKESPAAMRRLKANQARMRRAVVTLKKEPVDEESQRSTKPYEGPMTVVHVDKNKAAVPPLTTEIKEEKQDETELEQRNAKGSAAATPPSSSHRSKPSWPSNELKHFAVVPYNGGSNSSTPKSGSKTEALKITLVSKQSPKESGGGPTKTPIYATAAQLNNAQQAKNKDPYAFEANNNVSNSSNNHNKDRKVENIKLKIDLSRQNSVTIINSSTASSSSSGKKKDSSSSRDKEWKVKTKKDKEKDSPRSVGKNSNYLTVPPLTIKAERISPPSSSAKSPLLPKNQGSPKTRSSLPSRLSPPAVSPPAPRTEEEKKSLFLKSVALIPISTVANNAQTTEASKKPVTNKMSPPKATTTSTGSSTSTTMVSATTTTTTTASATATKLTYSSSPVAVPPLFKIPASVGPAPKATNGSASPSGSKRKSSEPMKSPASSKKVKPTSPPATMPYCPIQFKIKLPPQPAASSSSPTATTARATPTNHSGTITCTSSNTYTPTTSTPPLKSTSSSADKPLMPPPAAPLAAMKPPAQPGTANSSWARPKTQKTAGQNQRSALLGLTPLLPHPLFGGGNNSSGMVQPSPPGNRTPIAKRYQPILPKAARPNPFANIPCDVNQILKNAGTEIKTINGGGANESKTSVPSNSVQKVYGPRTDTKNPTHQQPPQRPVMGPPSTPFTKPTAKSISPSAHNQQRGTGKHSQIPAACNNSNNNNNYRNLALYNSSKSRGNDAPPGYRTPIYTPNSPIYSPSSPQYVPNFSIPTVPMYKYTPKPSNITTSSTSTSTSSSSTSSSSSSSPSSNSSGGETSYLQSILSTNSSMSNLFPSPPVQKDSPKANSPPIVSELSKFQQQPQQHQAAPKRVYPFSRSPSPANDDPPEKQSKVMKSLLNSCNINIPSSLSITITREDSESQSNSGSYPKRKSPVNNYIEILKLPDQQAPTGATAAGNVGDSDNKRSSPPMQKVGALLTNQNVVLTTRDKDDKPSSPPAMQQQQQQQQQQQVARKAVPVSTATMPIAPPSTPNLNGLMQNGNAGKQKQQQQQHQPPPTTQQGSGKLTTTTTTTPPTSTSSTTKPSSHFNNASSNNYHNNNYNEHVVKVSAKSPTATTITTTTAPPTTSPPGTQPQQQQKPQIDKRTPSPEKKPANANNSQVGNKSPNEQQAQQGSGGKKFRPILPRQIPTPIPEVIPPKITSANIIGTYSSPSGVAVKVHANKKLPTPGKKSPTSGTSTNNQNSPALSPNAGQKSQSMVPSAAKSPTLTKGSPLGGVNNLTSASSTSTTTTSSSITSAKSNGKIAKAGTPPPEPSSSLNNKLTLPSPSAINSKYMPPPQSPLSMMSPPPMVGAKQANEFNLFQQAVAAAANNQSNMIYSYAAVANAAAQMGLQFPAASVFGYPQAYLMAMQRTGNEVLNEYVLQKLKNVAASANDNLSASLPLSPPMPGLPALPPPPHHAMGPVSSPKTSPPTGASRTGNNNSPKTNNKNSKTNTTTTTNATTITSTKAK